MSSKKIKITVRDTQNIVYTGMVDRISSFNELGPFDIYPMHANFISIILKRVNLYIDGKMIKEIKTEQAVMKVKHDEVRIYLGVEALFVDEPKK
jgi:hypothetical protein